MLENESVVQTMIVHNVNQYLSLQLTQLYFIFAEPIWPNNEVSHLVPEMMEVCCSWSVILDTHADLENAESHWVLFTNLLCSE